MEKSPGITGPRTGRPCGPRRKEKKWEARIYVEQLLEVFALAELKKLFSKNREKLLEIWTHLKYASCFHTMATTGIRSGEARALQWQDVSWDQKGLLILRAVKADGSIRQPKAKEILPVYLSDQGF